MAEEVFSLDRKCTQDTMGQREHHWQSDSGAMTVWYKLFVKDFNLLKLCFFILTSYFLYGELRLFFVEKPSLTSEGKASLAPRHFPEIIICPINGYDKEKLEYHGYETSYRYAIDEFLPPEIMILIRYLFLIGVPTEKTFFGWQGKFGNMSVSDVETDISVLKNRRFVTTDQVLPHS